METKRVTFKGISIEDSNNQSFDGVCESVQGLIPIGNPQNPQWGVNWHGKVLPVSLWTSGTTFLKAHISKGVLFLFVKVSSNNHEIWKSTISSGTYSTKVVLLTLPGAGSSDYWHANFVENKIGFWLSIIPNSSSIVARQYYYRHEKGILVPDVIPLLGNDYSIGSNARSTSQANYLREYPNGDQPGFLRNKDKFFSFIFAYRLKNGLHARHSQPTIRTVQQLVDSTNKHWMDFTVARYNFRYAFKYKDEDFTGGAFQVGQTIERIIPRVPPVSVTATIAGIDTTRKIIIISENTGPAINIVNDGATFTGISNPNNGATAKFDGGRSIIHSNDLFSEDTRSYFDQSFLGLNLDGNNSFYNSGPEVNLSPAVEALKEQVDSIDVFMCLPQDTEQQALETGIYYYAGSFTNEITSFDIKFNEESLAIREILSPDAFTHHWHVGHSLDNLRERIVLGGVYNNFGIPMLNYIKDNSPGTADFLVWVTIEKDGVEYQIGGNITNIALEDGTIIEMPRYLTYPDRDAKKIDLWWANGNDYELAFVYNLKAHPNLNLAYTKLAPFNYTKGTSASTSTPSNNYSVKSFYEPEEFKVGDLQKSYYPLLQTYKVDAGTTIRGVVQNVTEVSEGQFGEYPLYILCDQGIYGANQGSGDVLFSRIDKISSEYGIVNQEAFAVKNGYLWAADTNRLWVLRGSQIEEIHWPLLFNNENVNLFPVLAVGKMFTQDSVIFAGARENFVFNSRYGTWYSYRNKGIDHVTATGYVTTRHFFDYQSKTYELANLIGNIAQSNNGIVNLDDPTKYTDDVVVYLKTRPFKLDESIIYKSLKTGILRSNIEIASGKSLIIRLYGQLYVNNSPVLLTELTITNETLRSPVIRSNYGPFQSFILEVTGTIKGNSVSLLEDLLVQYVPKTYKLKP